MTAPIAGTVAGWAGWMLGAAAAFLGALAMPVPGIAVQVATGPGPAPWFVPIPREGLVELAYRHSVWGVQVVERFQVGPAGLRLLEVVAATPEIAGYYGLPDARLTHAGRLYRLRVEGNRALPELRVRATEVGDRTLVAGGWCLPLSRVGARVVLRPVTMPVGLGWLTPAAPCREPVGEGAVGWRA